MRPTKKGIISILCLILVFVLSACDKKIEKISIAEMPVLNVGDTYQLRYSIEPDGVTDELVFSSADESIATVDKHGNVTAQSSGNTIITVRPLKPNKKTDVSGTVKVSVVQPVLDICCIPEITLAVGKSADIDARIFPENADDPTVIYKSEDESVATVDVTGKIIAVGRGQTTIHATASSGVFATAQITVQQPVTGITLSESYLEIQVGESYIIAATTEPDNADLNTKVTFASLDESIAVVDENGVITAVSSGKTAISATAIDVDENPLVATCEVTAYIPAPKIYNRVVLSSDDAWYRLRLYALNGLHGGVWPVRSDGMPICFFDWSIGYMSWPHPEVTLINGYYYYVFVHNCGNPTFCAVDAETGAVYWAYGVGGYFTVAR